MRSTLDSTLPCWIAGPALGLVIMDLLGLANKRFGVVGGRVLALAVGTGVVVGVALQPRLARAAERILQAGAQLPALQASEVL